jgi:uncharacterized membrane protein
MLTLLKSPKAWFTLFIVTGYALLPGVLPPRFREERTWDPKGWNWFGHPFPASILYAVGLLLLLFVLRYLIIRRSRRARDAVAWYCLTVAIFLPAIWLLVVIDRDNQAVDEIACWVGYPVALLFVPSVLFGVDWRMGSWLTPGGYAIQSGIELLVLIPIWLYLWVWIEFLILGWIGV